MTFLELRMQTHLKWDIEIERVETSFMEDYYSRRYKKVVS